MRVFLFLSLALVCLLCPHTGTAQYRDGAYYLTIDSLPLNLDGMYWRYTDADIKNGADTALDDRQWKVLNSRLRTRTDTANAFNGLGWLRLHLIVDSTLAQGTQALRFWQSGASEVYLDGKLLHRYGQVSPRDSVSYVNPQGEPLNLPTLSIGRHVVAVRYANWEAMNNARHYNDWESGFRVSLLDADYAFRMYNMRHSIFLIAFVLLFAIFFTLSLVHIFLYLYYRAEDANLRFSLFALCVSVLLLIPAIVVISEDALFIRNLYRMALVMAGVAGITLSFLLNGLFSKRRWHLYISVVTCLLLILTVIIKREWAGYTLAAVIGVISLEALYILVSAMVRRQPGARIIGGGLLMLVLLMVLIVGIVIVEGDVTISDNSLLGQLILFILIFSCLSIPISMSMYLAWRFSRVHRDLKKQLVQVETLSNQTREQEQEKQRLLESRQEELEHEVAERTANLLAEKKKSDDLLLNILPPEIAQELKETGRSEARLYADVSVLFTDFVDFTQLAEKLSPAELVSEIDHCFQAFDSIIEQHGLEKIKTIGDAYLAVSGLPAENPKHAQAVVSAALEIREYMAELKERNPDSFEVRLGVHSGPVVAGIVGIKKFAYDIWGDTVNTAARMEQHSEPGSVNISNATYELVKDEFVCTYRGELEAKHKGKMGMYFVAGSKEMAIA
jgi:adenylate cyclase